MKYMGSKNRIAKDILPIIFRNHTPEQFYVEPFVGGCNLIDKVNCKRIGNDAHYYLIEMYKAFQSGWTPPKYISKDEWKDAKLGLLTGEFKDALTGYIGFNASFGGK